MTTSPLLRRPAFVRLGIALDTAPAAIWLALFAAALWPTAWWMGQRMLDGSDEPLGLLALAALAVLVWHCRGRLRAAPRLGWLAFALAAAVTSTALLWQAPPLVTSLFGLLALGSGLIAFLPAALATAPVLGLSLLSLPLLASLQFYAGYPLRVITAETSRWLSPPSSTSSAAAPHCASMAIWSLSTRRARACRCSGSVTSLRAWWRCTRAGAMLHSWPACRP